MSRLFITPREINFINDIAKEIVKDVIGQKIYYFPISEIKSRVHDVYEESVDKIFENPIELDALVKYQEQETALPASAADHPIDNVYIVGCSGFIYTAASIVSDAADDDVRGAHATRPSRLYAPPAASAAVFVQHASPS